jgi:hemin uptake protein HemP
MSDDKPKPEEMPKSPIAVDPAVINGRQLFQGKREIWIEHDGIRYRLRITRRNKLILQK